jgi:hypothetical protein
VYSAGGSGTLIAIDEVGYVPMADVGAEFLFQVIVERAEKAARHPDRESAVFRKRLVNRSGEGVLCRA